MSEECVLNENCQLPIAQGQSDLLWWFLGHYLPVVTHLLLKTSGGVTAVIREP